MENALNASTGIDPQNTQGPQPIGGEKSEVEKKLDLQAAALFELDKTTKASIGDLLKEAGRIEKIVDRTTDLTHLGFIIMIIMVAAMVATYFQQSITTNTALIDKITTLEIQLSKEHR